MILPGELYKKMLPIIGIKGANAGAVYEVFTESGKKETVRLLSYWVFVIRGFQPEQPVDELLIGTFKSTKWIRAICLVNHEDNDNLPNDVPDHYLSLASWSDPVAKSLQSYNVFPEDVETATTYHFDYAMSFGTRNMFGDISSWAMFPPNINLPLWNALEECMVYFAEQYNSEALKAYIGYDELKEKVNQRKDKD